MYLTDCKGRSMQKYIFYAGYSDFSEVDKSDIHNHKYMARVKGKIPKDGKYYTTNEISDVVQYLNNGDASPFKDINTNFRNVQYIIFSHYVLWLYCIKEENLEHFDFVGKNLTEGVLGKLLKLNGYKVGYVHSKREVEEVIKIFYHPDKLIAILAHYSNGFCGFGLNLLNTAVYYNRFEEGFRKTDYTGGLFGSTIENIPFCDKNEAKLWLNHDRPINSIMSNYFGINDISLQKDMDEHGDEFIENFNEFINCLFNLEDSFLTL